MSNMYIIRNYIIVFAILLAPIILIVSGLILRKSKKNLSTGIILLFSCFFISLQTII